MFNRLTEDGTNVANHCLRNSNVLPPMKRHAEKLIIETVVEGVQGFDRDSAWKAGVEGR